MEGIWQRHPLSHSAPVDLTADGSSVSVTCSCPIGGPVGGPGRPRFRCRRAVLVSFARSLLGLLGPPASLRWMSVSLARTSLHFLRSPTQPQSLVTSQFTSLCRTSHRLATPRLAPPGHEPSRAPRPAGAAQGLFPHPLPPHPQAVFRRRALHLRPGASRGTGSRPPRPRQRNRFRAALPPSLL